VGTGIATSVLEIAELLSDNLGFKEPPSILGTFREGDIRHCFADIAKAKRLLRYEPAVALRDGIKELIAWVSAQTGVVDATDKATDELRKWGLTEE
jgi:dTDP-L-rhamnose 4-epimerase